MILTKSSTRSKTGNLTFGQPSHFPLAMIPTKADVIRHYFYIRQREENTCKGECTKTHCFFILLEDLKMQWNKFSFPVIDDKIILSRINRLIESAQSLNKTPKSRRNDDFYRKIDDFDSVFGICSCDCCDLGKDRKHCRCEFKIPIGRMGCLHRAEGND